jgi:hypothetical protein
MNKLSFTLARIAIGVFGFAWSLGKLTTTWLGTSLVIQRIVCRQKRENV